MLRRSSWLLVFHESLLCVASCRSRCPCTTSRAGSASQLIQRLLWVSMRDILALILCSSLSCATRVKHQVRSSGLLFHPNSHSMDCKEAANFQFESRERDQLLDLRFGASLQYTDVWFRWNGNPEIAKKRQTLVARRRRRRQYRVRVSMPCRLWEFIGISGMPSCVSDLVSGLCRFFISQRLPILPSKPTFSVWMQI